MFGLVKWIVILFLISGGGSVLWHKLESHYHPHHYTGQERTYTR